MTEPRPLIEVAGLLLAPDLMREGVARTLLVRAAGQGGIRPPGDAVDEAETPLQAMVRAMRRQAGVETLPEDWQLRARINLVTSTTVARRAIPSKGRLFFYILRATHLPAYRPGKGFRVEPVRLDEVDPWPARPWLLPLVTDPALNFAELEMAGHD